MFVGSSVRPSWQPEFFRRQTMRPRTRWTEQCRCRRLRDHVDSALIPRAEEGSQHLFEVCQYFPFFPTQFVSTLARGRRRLGLSEFPQRWSSGGGWCNARFGTVVLFSSPSCGVHRDGFTGACCTCWRQHVLLALPLDEWADRRYHWIFDGCVVPFGCFLPGACARLLALLVGRCDARAALQHVACAMRPQVLVWCCSRGHDKLCCDRHRSPSLCLWATGIVATCVLHKCVVSLFVGTANG